MTIRRELIDELLKKYETPQDILGEGGLLKELTKAVIERCLETELETHLGYPKHGRKANATGNTRNGSSLNGQKELLGMWLAQTEGARVLALSAHGVAEPRRQGYLHRMRGWTDWAARGH